MMQIPEVFRTKVETSRLCGFINGISDKPVYVFIDNGEVEIRMLRIYGE